APSGFANYNWNPGLSATNTIYLSSAVPDTILLSLQISDDRGCTASDTMQVFFDLCSGVTELPSELIVQSLENAYRIIFPENKIDGGYTLYNMEGKKIDEGKMQSSVLLLPTSTYSNGIYILNIVGKGWAENIRISIN